jgi:hypothetical protein
VPRPSRGGGAVFSNALLGVRCRVTDVTQYPIPEILGALGSTRLPGICRMHFRQHDTKEEHLPVVARASILCGHGEWSRAMEYPTHLLEIAQGLVYHAQITTNMNTITRSRWIIAGRVACHGATLRDRERLYTNASTLRPFQERSRSRDKLIRVNSPTTLAWNLTYSTSPPAGT